MYARVNFYNKIDEFINSNIDKNKKYLIFTTEDTILDFDLLNSCNIEYYGAIFPQVIFKSKLFSQGLIVFQLNINTRVEFIENMNTYLFDESLFSDTQSIISIVDGFSDYNSQFLEEVFENIELDSNILGGGAGCFKNPATKSIFNKNGTYKNSAFLILLDKKVDIGVSHGWEVLEGPFVITKSEGKILKKLDYKNAFDVYSEVVLKDCGHILDEDNFYEIMKNYPIGIVRHNSDSIVRDVVKLNENKEIVFVGELEENSVINILKGKKESLIKAACKASKDATINESEFLMMFDCVSRLDYLDDEYSNQMDLIIEETSTKYIFGVISIGEIANKGNKYINFLNKTCVMGGICL